MNAMNVSYAMPEWILGTAAMVALFFDARDRDPGRKRVQRAAVVGVLLATLCAVMQGLFANLPLHAFREHYSVNAFSLIFNLDRNSDHG